MSTQPDQLALFRAALEAEENLFAHTTKCEHCTDLAVCAEAKHLVQQSDTLRRRALDQDGGHFDLDTVRHTAESIVRDMMLIVSAGRVDDDAQAAFCDWITDALLAQPTAHYIEQLCRSAGFAGPVEPALMKSRVDELHTTIAGLRQKLVQCHERLALVQSAGQAITATWEHGDLAYAVRQLAALLPK